jgi:TolC family type I secretion outer membrane protein
MACYWRIAFILAGALAILPASHSRCAAAGPDDAKPPAANAPEGTPALHAPATLSDNVVWDLDQVVQIALARHPQVSQADAETQAAQARKGQAQSPYYPAIELATEYSRFRGYSSNTDRNIDSTSISAQGNLSQIITDFGRTGSAVRRADALLSATRETGKTVREDVSLGAKVAYYNVLRAKRILSVSQETVRQRESLLRQARAFYDAGIRARIDVARAEANLFQARAELTSAENDLRVARITLLNRMGVDGPRDFELRDTLAAESLPGTLEEWIVEAEGNRPDLRSLVERERAAQMALRGARAGHNPVLTGNGDYGYSSGEFPLEETYSVSARLSVPIFTGFLVSRQVAEARAQLDAARYAVTDFRRLVRLQVEQAALSVRAAAERTDARRKEREASGENLRLATGRYEVGAGDIIEMIDAQAQMNRSDTDMINAVYDHSVSMASLLRAMGR